MSSLVVWDAVDDVLQRARTYEVDRMCRPQKFFNENAIGYAVQISGLLKNCYSCLSQQLSHNNVKKF